MKNFKPILFSCIVFTFLFTSISLSQSVPEILYYKFNNGVTTTPNYAFPGQGTNPALLLNQQLGPGGQFDSALVGVGGTSTSNFVNSGWEMNFGTSSWTISLWMNNIGTTTNYLFGNDFTTSFRCFTNGAAGAGNITLRGNGITNVNVTGVLPGPSVVHFVYDNTVPEIRVYVDGAFQSAVPQAALNLNATIPFKVGGYGTASAIGAGWLLDEFRVYSRALDASEIAATWNQTLPIGTGGVLNPTIVCDYGLIPQYPGGALGGHASDILGDTLYIVGGSIASGSTVNPTTTVTRYAINSGVWSDGTPLPTARLGGDLVKCGNALYYIGGGTALSGTGANNLTYKYDPTTGWSSVAPIPTPVIGNVAECWGDSVIYSIAGGWTQYYRGIQIYRPDTDTWSRANDSLPVGAGRRSFAGGLEDDKIFIVAGWSGAFRKDMYIGEIGATAEDITFTPGPEIPMRGTGTSRPGGHAVNGRFYMVTGETTPAPAQQDSIYLFDIATNSWLPDILVGRGENTASNYWGVISSKIINDKVRVFIPGGFWPTTVNTTKLIVLTDSIDCVITNISGNTNEIPLQFSLSQNYPNPFNPETRIQFAIPEAGFVKLKIFDILGREVHTLVNEHKNAGQYIIDFNASGLSSGTYFYRLEAGDFNDVKRMILLK